jgi:hypothetical protein
MFQPESNKKDSKICCIPIDFFNESNKPLKSLCKKDKEHISRHIHGASFIQFCESIKRQKELYRITKTAFNNWKDFGSKISDFPGYIQYPCTDCLKIARKLKI